MVIHKNYTIENISEIFKSEKLGEKELAQIVGGKRRKGKSRDKDHLDLDDVLGKKK